VKTRCNLVQSCEEGCGSKRAVLPMLIYYILIYPSVGCVKTEKSKCIVIYDPNDETPLSEINISYSSGKICV
jgi:hypothetical protein